MSPTKFIQAKLITCNLNEYEYTQINSFLAATINTKIKCCT
jgi:hypothetical protein